MFSKPTPDATITGREKYRTIRPECSGLKVRTPELDPESFRALVACFGANGSIPEISKLIDEASDRTIRQTVDLLNATFLANAGVRADSRGIVRSLKKKGRWEPALAGFSPAFVDPDRIRALINLLSLGNRNSLIVKTVQSFDPTSTQAGFEVLSRLVKTRAFGELSRKLKSDPLNDRERGRLLEILAEFFRRPTSYHSARLLLEDMIAGRSAPVWKLAFGEGESILEASSRFRLLLKDFSGNDGLRRLALFHRGFHRPVSCWGDGKVFAEPWKNLSRELTIHARAGEVPLLGFVGRFAPMTALGIPELCAMPDEFLEHYPAIMRLTAGRSGGEYLRLLHLIFTGGFGENAGYFVGEWGVSLAEALTMVEAKSWFGDLLLLVGELDAEDRDLFAGWMRTLLRDREAWTAVISEWSAADLGPVFADVGQLLVASPTELATMLDSIRELFESSRVHPWFEGWKKIAAESDANGMQSLTDLKGFPEAATAIGRMAEDGRLAAILGDVLELLAGAAGERSAVVVESESMIRKSPRHGFVGSDLRAIETLAAMDVSLRACANLDLRKAPREQRETYEACLAGGGVDAGAIAGLRAAQSWTITDGDGSRSFLDSLLRGWISLPLTVSEKRELIAMVTGKRDGLPPVTPEAVRETIDWIRDRIGTADGVSPTRFFSILNRFQNGLRISLSKWESFFEKIGRVLDDQRFVPMVRALRTLTDPAVSGDTKIGPAPIPPTDEITEWVRDLECERDPRLAAVRAGDIVREYREGVVGWERPGGKIPLRWEPEPLKVRLRALAESLTPDLRANLYAWLGSLDSKRAAKWFVDRGGDSRLVAVMDPDTEKLRVRSMTSLDRLESILVNSDFSYLINGNFGLKFMAKFAEAWGDEPRSRWPREIQERYSGRKTPPRLEEVYAEILAFIRWFEKFGGMPSVPKCVAKDGAIAPTAFEESWASAPDLVVPFSVKAKAFNLKQTLSVVGENLPGASGSGAEGMRLLRDLFWAVHSSAPRADRDPGTPERNPLRFIQRLGDLGGLRSISRGLQSLELASERIALEDAFGGLRLAVGEPALDRILAKFLANPASLDRLVDASAQSSEFRVGTFLFGAFSALAADRTLRVSPAIVRFLDSILVGSDETLPISLLADAVLWAGEKSSSPVRLRTLRAPDSATRERIAGFGAYLETRALAALHEFPLREAVTLLDRDAALRNDLILEGRRWVGGEARQSDGGRPANVELGPYFDLILSDEHPEVRRAIGLWCRRSAGRYAFELSSRPDEALLMIDGLLRSGRSEAFNEFLEALLRELPN